MDLVSTYQSKTLLILGHFLMFSYPRAVHDILNMPNFNHLQQMQPLGASLQNLTHRSTPLSLGGMSGGGAGSPLMSTGLPIGLGLPQSPQMPQLVLASGQLGQGIQGAQVLIPTPQGELYALKVHRANYSNFISHIPQA